MMKKFLPTIFFLVFVLIFSGCTRVEEETITSELPPTSMEEMDSDSDEPEEIPEEDAYRDGEDAYLYSSNDEEIDENEDSELSSDFGTPRPFPGNGVLDYASEEDMVYYLDAPRFSLVEEGIWMKFYFDRPVSNVVFVASPMAGYDEELELLLFSLGEVYYEVGDLSAGEPFFIQTWGTIGTTPAQAIGLTNEDGMRYYIPFIQCQMDGDLLLLKQSAFTFPE